MDEELKSNFKNLNKILKQINTSIYEKNMLLIIHMLISTSDGS